MKKTTQYSIAGLMSILLTLALITGCSITDPSDDFEIYITLPESGAIISGQVADGNGNLITDSQVNLTVLGEDAGVIVDLLNEPLQSLTTTSGFLVIAVNDTITPTREDPIEITLKIDAENYMTTYKNLVLYSANDVIFNIFLVSADINDLPPGLTGAEDDNGECDNTGAVTTPVNLVSPPNPISGAMNTINIDSGTRILDPQGSPLTGGLTASMMVMDMSNPRNVGASQYFPGGFDDIQTDDPDLRMLPKSFTVFSVTDDGGKVAGNFDPPVGITMQISGDSYNARTLRPIADGDIMSFFTLDDNGIWNHQIDSPISGPDGNGNFSVTYLVAETAVLPGLKGGDNFLSNGDPENNLNLLLGDQGGDNLIGMNTRVIVENGEGHMLEVEFGCTDLFHSLTRENNIGIFDFYLDVPNQPIALELIPQIVTANVYDRNDNLVAELFDAQFVDVNANPLQLNITSTGFTPQPDLKTVDIHLFALMPPGRDPSEIRPSGIASQIQEVGQNGWSPVGVVQSGIIEVSGLKVGSSYIFKGTYTFNGETRTADTPWEREITADKDSLQYMYQLSEDEADDYER
ncbi:hypothetical protein H8D57_00300 [bacterium]|nr:hypothetical protein [bacterium]